MVGWVSIGFFHNTRKCFSKTSETSKIKRRIRNTKNNNKEKKKKLFKVREILLKISQEPVRIAKNPPNSLQQSQRSLATLIDYWFPSSELKLKCSTVEEAATPMEEGGRRAGRWNATGLPEHRSQQERFCRLILEGSHPTYPHSLHSLKDNQHRSLFRDKLTITIAIVEHHASLESETLNAPKCNRFFVDFSPVSSFYFS